MDAMEENTYGDFDEELSRRGDLGGAAEEDDLAEEAVAENDQVERTVIKELDGATLEGGGQILRNAAALAAIQGRPVRISNVRGMRSRPGLRKQHQIGLETIADICGGTLRGCELGSSEVDLEPSGNLRHGEWVADTHTAGSCALIAQTAVPVLLLAQGASSLVCKGGTDAMAAPPADFLLHVLQPVLEKVGLGKDHIHFHLERRGFFPRGGGELRVDVHPPPSKQPLAAFEIEDRGALEHVEALVWSAGKASGAAKRIWEAADHKLRESAYGNLVREPRYSALSARQAVGSSAGILLIAHTSSGWRLAASAQLERGMTAEDVGEAAVSRLLPELDHGGCVDEHVQDQLIIFMALAKGTSSMVCGPLSLHTKTAIWVASELTSARFKVAPLEAPHLWRIVCEGAAISAR